MLQGVNYHGAPLAIIVCGDHSDVFVRPFDKKDMVSVDATIVADHIVLEAEDLGLSSCWLSIKDRSVVAAADNSPMLFLLKNPKDTLFRISPSWILSSAVAS